MRTFTALILILMSILGCQKKKKVTVPVVQFTDVPANPTNVVTLGITVSTASGDPAKTYQYVILGNGATSCTGATYSDWIDISQKITDKLAKDDTYLLCALGQNEGGVQVTATSYPFALDTVAPEVTFTLGKAFGPGYTVGDATVFTGTASDAASGMASVTLSIQHDSGKCLATSLDAFNASCPNNITATISGKSFAVPAIADDLFGHGESYKFTLVGTDKAGNATTIQHTATYESVVPEIPAGLNVTAGTGRLILNWSAASRATSYVVLRRAGTAVAAHPVQGTSYTAGKTFTTGEVVAYVGSATTLTDDNLSAGTEYFYAVYGTDDAYNYSSAVTGSATPEAAFEGPSYAFVAGPGRLLGALWQLVDDGKNTILSYVYQLFSSATAGGQDYSTASGSYTSGASFGAFSDAGSGATAYVTSRAHTGQESAATNSREIPLNLAAGYHHRILGFRGYNGEPAKSVFINAADGVALDPWSNAIFSANNTFVYVLCQENVEAPYCRGRALDGVYALFGNDSSADGADAAAPSSSFGYLSTVDVDGYGNIYALDTSFARIRVQCNNTSSGSGFCAAKQNGNVYRLIGTGAAGTTVGATAASTSSIAAGSAMRLDRYGNVYFGDSTRLWVICNTVAGPSCTGKTLGNVYVVAGTGVSTDGSNGAAISTGMGTVVNIDFDSTGNVFLTDITFNRVRAVCLTASGIFCTGKSAGSMYQVAGDGTTADGADGAASSAAIGQPSGIALDSFDNIILGDVQNDRLRVLCLNAASSSGACHGKTVNMQYQLAGTGIAGDGADGAAADTAMGSVHHLVRNRYNNIIYSDNTYARLRIVCLDNDKNDFCYGRYSNETYGLVGSGGAVPTFATARPAITALATGIKGMAVDSASNLFYTDADNYTLNVICFNVSTTGTYCYGKTKGYHYRVMGTGSINLPGTNPVPYATAAIGDLGGGVVIDAYDNAFVASTWSDTRIRALCFNANGGFCSGKTSGMVYKAAGNGALAGGPADNSSALSVPIGYAGGLVADTFGNIFWMETTYGPNKIYALCNNIASDGKNFCAAKTLGNLYIVAGYDTAADSSDDVVATGSSAGVGTSYVMSRDSYNNIFFADMSYYRVRAVCNNTAGGFCSGKTAGHLYRVAGTGASANGADGTTFASFATGQVFGTAMDKYDNLFLLDSSFHAIRILCFNVSSGNGFCSGKTAGDGYIFANGSGDGGSNIARASASFGYTAWGQLLAVNPLTNDLFLADHSYQSIRMFIGY